MQIAANPTVAAAGLRLPVSTAPSSAVSGQPPVYKTGSETHMNVSTPHTTASPRGFSFSSQATTYVGRLLCQLIVAWCRAQLQGKLSLSGDRNLYVWLLSYLLSKQCMGMSSNHVV